MTHSPDPRPAELPRRRLLATGARAAAAVLAVAGAGACGLAHSTSASQSLPTPSPAEVRRDALARRAALIGTNPDRFCPFPGGMGQPDCAAVVAAIEACTGTRAETVLGKPNPQMARTALRGLDIDLERAVMVGDRLMTDIRLATTAGMASAMPLTGESTREEAAALPPQERPTYVLERVDHLLPRDI